MLEEISLSNIGIIKQARLPFHPGVTAVTGETGAGKSMILNSLHLLMGRRTDSTFVRPGADEAIAEGCWMLTRESSIEAAENTGATLDEGRLFINRSLKSDGKSRAVVGGRSTPAKVLQELSHGLVNIHGQADQHHLRSASAQLRSLDRYGQEAIHAKATAYSAAYKKWQSAKKALETLTATWDAQQKEYRQLKAFAAALEELAPQPDELSALTQEIATLSNLDVLREGLIEAIAFIAPEDFEVVSPLDMLQQAHSKLAKLGRVDALISEYSDRLGEALDIIDEVTKEIELRQQTLDEDGLERLYHCQDRHTELDTFMKRYTLTWDELMEQADEAPQRLAAIDPASMSLTDLQAKAVKAEAAMHKAAAALTKARQAASVRLAEEVNGELAALSMGAQKFVVALTEVKPTPKGADEVQFMLLNPGATKAAPIATAASGGELSRLMLALELVLADESIPTFVFDEIDSGVGGATAIEIGKRLATLARTAQVIVVTHLPQVAAFADGHLKVSKTTAKTAVTTVVELDHAARVEELTRMFSGLSESTSGQAHAEELLAYASSFKGN